MNLKSMLRSFLNPVRQTRTSRVVCTAPAPYVATETKLGHVVTRDGVVFAGPWNHELGRSIALNVARTMNEGLSKGNS